MKHVGTECQSEAYVLTCSDSLLFNLFSDGSYSHDPSDCWPYSLTYIYIDPDFPRDACHRSSIP